MPNLFIVQTTDQSDWATPLHLGTLRRSLVSHSRNCWTWWKKALMPHFSCFFPNERPIHKVVVGIPESKQPALQQRWACVTFFKTSSALCSRLSGQVWRQMERHWWTEGWEAQRQRPKVMRSGDDMKAGSQKGLLMMVRRQKDCEQRPTG